MGIVITVQTLRTTAFDKILVEHQFIWFLPIIIGLLFYARFIEGYSWLSRYPISILMGIGVAITMRTIITADFVKQIEHTIINPFATGTAIVGSPKFFVNNILIIVIVITTLWYFLFTGGTTIQNNRISKGMTEAGKYFMLVSFGAAFANVMMTRIAVTSGRIRYILQPLNKPIIPFIILLIIVVMIPKEWVNKIRAKN